MPKKTTGTPVFEPRKYVCTRWPYLRLRKGVKFDRGVYVAATQELADIVEANEQFGGLIRRVFDTKKGKDLTPDPLELEVAKILKQSEPAVRRGAISTSSITG